MAQRGDESVVPHKGICAGPLRMFIARKPHSTGIKLYRLANATSWYVVDMYQCTGRRGHVRRFGYTAGNFTAQKFMTRWAGRLPTRTILCADSFFGLHEPACDLAANSHPFLMMTKRFAYGADTVGQLLAEGQTALCTVDDARYSFGHGSREPNLSCMSPSRSGWLQGFLRASLRNAMELAVFRNFISFVCRATLLTLAPLSFITSRSQRRACRARLARFGRLAPQLSLAPISLLIVFLVFYSNCARLVVHV